MLPLGIGPYVESNGPATEASKDKSRSRSVAEGRRNIRTESVSLVLDGPL